MVLAYTQFLPSQPDSYSLGGISNDLIHEEVGMSWMHAKQCLKLFTSFDIQQKVYFIDKAITVLGNGVMSHNRLAGG